MSMTRSAEEKRNVIIEALPHLDLTDELVGKIGNLILNEGCKQLAAEETKTEVETMDRQKVKVLQHLTWTRW